MIELFDRQAQANNVWPIDHRFGAARATPTTFDGTRKHFEYWGKDVSVPAIGAAPFLAARSFTINADLVLDKPDTSGAVLAWGSRFGGWSLYLDRGRPAFVWSRSTDPQEIVQVTADKALPQGRSKLTLRFASQGFGKPADAVLSAGGVEMARVTIDVPMLMPAGGGETMDVGRDLGVTVIDYATPHGAIEGDVPHVVIDFD